MFSASELYITPDNVATDWICLGAPQTESDGCDVKKVEREADNWTVVSKRIDHCLARVTPAHCKLQFSQAILIVVIVMNFAKAVVMGYTFWAHKSSTLVTIGDAVSSFMCSRDPLTDFRCLMARKDVDHGPLQWCCGDDDEKSRSVQRKCSAWVSQLYTSTVSYLRSGRRELHGHRPRVQPLPQTWQGNREVWFRAASRKRWVATTLLLSTALIATAVLLVAGTRNDTLDSPAQAFRMGFGKIDPRLLVDSSLPIHGASGLLAAVLLANVPQIICSFLYLAYNGLFTCMLLAEEWSRYYLHPKPLRVTGPRGQQRSKYYLQLPFTYSIPLITASALLHWLISESIFLARIDYYSDGGERQADSYSLTGYSPVPILLVVIVGTVMTVVLLGHGFRKFSSPMPVVGSCSVAIASACHPPKGDADAAYLPVAWGDVNSDGDGEVGHCAFTSVQVYEPVKDRMYAGEDTAKWKRE